MSQHQPDWDFYFTTIEDEPASIALDIALADTAPVEELPWMLWASVKLMNPDENGFPTAEESVVLNSIEDDLNEALESIGAIPVGRIKSGGIQDFYFYSDAADEFEDLVLEVMKNYPDYLFATEATEDPEWDEYLGHLYPTHQQYQSMQNRRVIDQLIEQGDDLNALRDVDHFISFPTEDARAAFIAETLSLGFNILDKEQKEEQDDLPFTVNIVRKDNAVWERVDEYVWELCTLAGKYDGEYEGWGCEVVK